MDIESLNAEVRRIVRIFFGAERPDHTLQPTALANEVWLSLIRSRTLAFDSEGAFLAWAAQAVRSILVSHARRRSALKRKPVWNPSGVREGMVDPLTSLDVLSLHEALEQLESEHPRSARVVELRFFGGMGEAEIAIRLGVSTRTVRADWAAARAWLFGRLRSEH
ncbi:MAG: ECF-type sigma factor [Phycisphaerales bacterium]